MREFSPVFFLPRDILLGAHDNFWKKCPWLQKILVTNFVKSAREISDFKIQNTPSMMIFVEPMAVFQESARDLPVKIIWKVPVTTIFQNARETSNFPVKILEKVPVTNFR